MNILVVGNGFDLAHNFPTRYWDFMMFIKSFKKMEILTKDDLERLPEFNELNEDIQKYLLKDEVFNKGNRSDALNELSVLVSNNVWIEYFIDKVHNYANKGWIDFEAEISEIVKALDYYIEYHNHELKNNGIDFHRDDTKESINYTFLKYLKQTTKLDVKKININYFHGDDLKEIIDELNNDLNGLIRCLEIYIGEIIEKFDKYKVIKQIQDLSIDKLISFNYTNTYKKLYELGSSKIEYDYLHGNANSNRDIKENNMVLGIDEYLEEKQRDKKLDFIKFKKYFQRIYKKTGCKYKEWFENISDIQKRQEVIRESAFSNNVYIFGHSMDVTDKDVLADILELKDTQITIFYLDNKDYAQKITNIIKIIGQDKLTNSVYGKNPKIIFKEIEKQ